LFAKELFGTIIAVICLTMILVNNPETDNQMRSLLKLFLLIIPALFSGCEKPNNPAIEDYINQLASGRYTSIKLPAFQPADIPALLNYCNDTRVITNITGGISSYHILNHYNFFLGSHPFLQISIKS
jgi:hypothetical protein